MHPLTGFCSAALGIVTTLACGLPCQAQPTDSPDQLKLDRVTVGPFLRRVDQDSWKSREVLILDGRVRRFNADELVIQTADGEQKFSSARIESVDIQWANPTCADAMRLVEQQRYADAIPAIEEALKIEIPVWQQPFMLAGLVRSLDALGRGSTAGLVFIKFLEPRSPPPTLYADLPLCWNTQEPNATMQARAQEWLGGETETEQLLGASWLLLTPETAQAEAKLKQLQNSERPTLSEMATMQLWRLTPPPQTRERLPGWLLKRDALLPALQLGPTEFLAERLSRIGESELAMGQWMRIASKHMDRYHRAERALKSAASLLQREGKLEEAAKLDSWLNQLKSPPGN